MKRYYISKIIGDGSDLNPYRTKVAGYGVNHVSVIENDPATGAPLHAFALCLVNAVNHAPLLIDPDIDALPDVGLDIKMSAVHTATKNALLSRLTARGFDTADFGTADGFRDVVKGIGLQLSPTFNENHFDVSE